MVPACLADRRFGKEVVFSTYKLPNGLDFCTKQLRTLKSVKYSKLAKIVNIKLLMTKKTVPIAGRSNLADGHSKHVAF